MVKVKTAINKLPIVVALFYGANMLGALIFSLAEHVGFGDSVYWAFITSLSVGYGDISPDTVIGKIVAVLLAKIVLLAVLPLLISHYQDRAYENRNEYSDDEQKRVERKLDLLLEKLECDRSEFAQQ